MGADNYHWIVQGEGDADSLRISFNKETARANKLVRQLCELQDKYDKLEALYNMKVVTYG